MASGIWVGIMVSKRVFAFGMMIFAFLLVSSVSAEGVTDAETVSTIDNTVCCEKTNAGLYCQDVPAEDCSSEGRQLPTSCESTSFCNPGFCYDSTEGTCLDNVPQLVCNQNNGTWSETEPAACGLGCCILGDQASFTTLVRCKRLSGFYGLESNWDGSIQDETQCILTARAEERGACVFEQDYETTCKMTTRSECGNGNIATTGNSTNSSTVGEKFYPGMLCSANELDTICGPTRDTTCVSGKEEVYFVDTCGNPANIYDASKINDQEYWTYIKDKTESCTPDESNENSQTCGNCNYLLGGYCSSTSSETARPTYGNNICASLNCVWEGEEKLHGESWCMYDDENYDFEFKETPTQSNTALTSLLDQARQAVESRLGVSNEFLGSTGGDVGSKFYRLVCSHGEVLVEPCADFRQEECIENNVAGYTEAACRVNRWQDCTSQFTRDACENTDQRDCRWMDGIEFVLVGGMSNGSTLDQSSLAGVKQQLKDFNSGARELGACVPKNPPGLRFWGTTDEKTGETANSEAAAVCSQANAFCPVTYEKGLVGGDWECIENCECLEAATQTARAQLCMALGDCGPKTNYLDVKGSGKGYKILTEEMEKED